MKMVEFEYINNELTVFKEGTSSVDDYDIFNYCDTLAGHTLMIGARYELVPTEIKGIYTIKEKAKKE